MPKAPLVREKRSFSLRETKFLSRGPQKSYLQAPERVSEGLRDVSQRLRERKKVVGAGLKSRLADFKTRFWPKMAPKRAPRGPQERPRRGLEVERRKNQKLLFFLRKTKVFGLPGEGAWASNGYDIRRRTSCNAPRRLRGRKHGVRRCLRSEKK